MASPQKEHGFTPIAHELLLALIHAKLSAQKLAAMLLVMRHSYGNSKKIAVLSYLQIAQELRITRPNAAKLMRELGLSRCITPLGVIRQDNASKNGWKIQKDYDQWATHPPLGVIRQDNLSVIRQDNPPHRLPTVRTGGIKGVNVNILSKEKKTSLAADHLLSSGQNQENVPEVLADLPLYSADKKLCVVVEKMWPTWKKAYPDVDLDADIRRAHAWEQTNSIKKNRARFLNSWFARTQDSPRKSVKEKSKGIDFS